MPGETSKIKIASGYASQGCANYITDLLGADGVRAGFSADFLSAGDGFSTDFPGCQ